MSVTTILTTDIVPKGWRRTAPAKCGHAYSVIDDAQLPKQLDTWIRTLVRGLKLWRAEREDIARELVSHIQHALDEGAKPEDLAAQLGDPKQNARLIRRAAKRKRPFLWRMARRGFWGTLAALGACVVLYAALMVRFWIGSPQVSTDYLALLNAEAESCAEYDRAWPVYRDTSLAWQLHAYDEQNRQRRRGEELRDRGNAPLDTHDESGSGPDGSFSESGIDLVRTGHVLDPNHPDFASTLETFRAFAPEFEKIRAAAQRPCLGAIVSDRVEETKLNDRIVQRTTHPPSTNLKDRETLLTMRIPYVGETRALTLLLRADALFAALDGDADRVAADLRAILGIADQLSGSHAFLINDLVVSAMIATVTEDLARHHLGPDKLLMSEDQLRAIRDDLAALAPSITIRTSGERMMFEDILQRCFTDDGRGNGRITPEGIKLLQSVSALSTGLDQLDMSNKGFVAATGPVALTLVGDRESQRDIYHGMMDAVDYAVASSVPVLDAISTLELELYERRNGLIESPAFLLTPALGSAVNRVFLARAKHAATLVALDLELHRFAHGAYPDSLDDLDCARIPEDIFSPHQPIRYLRDPDAQGYTLYSVGEDGDDDHATPVLFADGTQQPHKIGCASKRHIPADASSDQAAVMDLNQPSVWAVQEDGDWVLVRVGEDPERATP